MVVEPRDPRPTRARFPAENARHTMLRKEMTGPDVPALFAEGDKESALWSGPW